jgi:hypothetical protein
MNDDTKEMLYKVGGMGDPNGRYPQPWVGLTDEERVEIQQMKWWDWEDKFDLDGFMQAIEAKLKEKNT